MEKNKDKEKFNGKMEVFLKVNGKTERNMERVNTQNMENNL